MSDPIFGPHPQAVPAEALPRALSTILFLHRIKQQMSPAKEQPNVDGHPIIKAPIIVRPKNPVHTSKAQLFHGPY